MAECKRLIGGAIKRFCNLARVVACTCMLVAPLLSFTELHATDFAAMEGQLRAAVTVGVLRFTTWQPPKKNAIELCLIGNPISEPFLLPVDGEANIGRKVLAVRRAKPPKWQGCHALVMGEQLSEAHSKAALAYAAAQQVLTVCDGCSSKIASDTMIQLNLEKQRVRFQINLSKANDAAVQLDASLLELATEVRK